MSKGKSIGLSVLHFSVYLMLQIVISLIIIVFGCVVEIMSNKQIITLMDDESVSSFNKIDQVSNLLMSETIYRYVLIALFISFLLNILYFVLIWYKTKEMPIKKLKATTTLRMLGFGVLLNLVISGLLNLAVSSTPISEANDLLNEMMGKILSGNFVLVLLSIGILGPIVEEMVFRYGVSKHLCNINPYFGIIFSSLLFGAMHMNLVQSTYATLLGLLFAFVYYKTDNLLYSILLHIGINSSSVVASTLFDTEYVGLVVCVVISLSVIGICYFIDYMNKDLVPLTSENMKDREEETNLTQNNNKMYKDFSKDLDKIDDLD